MKIVVLSSLAYSLVNFRGALIEEMRRRGHDVIAVAPDRNADVERWLSNIGVPLRVVPMNRTGTRPLEDARTLSAYVRLMKSEKPDVILAYTQKPIIYGGIAARIFGKVRFFALMSGLGYLFSPDGANKTLLRRLFCLAYREGLRRAEKIFVFNGADHNDMLEAGILSPRQSTVQVPGSGVDIQHFAEQPLPEGAPTVLMVGRLMRDKGVFEFIEAARRVVAVEPFVKFRILGRVEEDNPTGIAKREVERLSNEYPVEFLPETTDVRPFLRASNIFVLPSFYREGLPRTILEAMATGRAIVTTDLPGCRDPIRHGENGLLVPPRDPAALAQAILRLVQEPELSRSMAKRSRAIAAETYDVRLVNKLLLDEMCL